MSLISELLDNFSPRKESHVFVKSFFSWTWHVLEETRSYGPKPPCFRTTLHLGFQRTIHISILHFMFCDLVVDSMLLEPRVLLVWVCGFYEILSLLLNTQADQKKEKENRGAPLLERSTHTFYISWEKWARNQCMRYHLLSTQGGFSRVKVERLPKSPLPKMHIVPSCKLVKPDMCFSMKQ